MLLEQVARVEEGPAPKRGDASVDGHPGVVITIVKQPHADTRKLTDEVKAALRETEAALPADVVINTDLFQLKNFIDRGIYNVGEALVIGAVLVLIVLFLFLLNFRTTFITLTAIPLSLVITTLVFRLIGLLTGTRTVDQRDDARRHRGGDGRTGRRRHRGRREHLPPAAREQRLAATRSRPCASSTRPASRSARAIVFGTAVVILVFLPLFALSGVEGRLFAPLGIAYIVSILASLLVSLTVTPVLSYYLLPQSKATHRARRRPAAARAEVGGRLSDPLQHAPRRRCCCC